MSIGIEVGETYRFTIKAVHKWGTSDLSAPPLSVLAASRPEQVDSVVTSIDTATGGVKIEWSLPDELGSALITYLVEIKNSLGSWLTEESGCDQDSATLLTERSCIVPMSALSTSPFDLAFD